MNITLPNGETVDPVDLGHLVVDFEDSLIDGLPKSWKPEQASGCLLFYAQTFYQRDARFLNNDYMRRALLPVLKIYKLKEVKTALDVVYKYSTGMDTESWANLSEEKVSKKQIAADNKFVGYWRWDALQVIYDAVGVGWRRLISSA
jgi:hypothetical protein